MAFNKIFSLKHIYFMNKSLLVSLPFLIISCGYRSFYEASISCEKWREEGGTYTGVIEALKKNDNNKNQPEFLFNETKNNFPMRKCQFDKETNQILGLKVLNREKNKNYYFPQGQRLQNSPSNLIDIDLKWEINKRFKY